MSETPESNAPADDAVSTLQQRWEQVKYGAPAGGQERAFEALSAEADTVLSRYPGSPPASWLTVAARPEDNARRMPSSRGAREPARLRNTV